MLEVDVPHIANALLLHRADGCGGVDLDRGVLNPFHIAHQGSQP